MKVRILTAAALLLTTLFLLSSCYTEDPGPLQEDDKTFSIVGFDRLEMGSGFTIHVEQGTFFSVKAIGDRRNIDDLDIYKSGSTLIARYDDNHERKHQTTLYITMPELVSVNFSGASTSTVYGFSTNGDFDMYLSGASVSQLDVEADHLNIILSGASSLTVRGDGNSLDAELSGASELYAFNYSVNEAFINVSGASSGKINVSDQLDAVASGGSAILYRGNPSVSSDASGGSTIRRD